MIKTAGVLAGAYMRHAQGHPRTHLVQVVHGTQWPVREVLCRRADPRNITDDSTQWTDARPTCPACARKWDKLNAPTFVVFWNGHFHHASEDKAQAQRVAQHLREMGASKVTVGSFNRGS